MPSITNNIYTNRIQNISWQCGCYGNCKYILITGGSTNNIFAYSTDGITWTEGTLLSYQNYQSIYYANGKFILVSNEMSSVIYSTDGINWSNGAALSRTYMGASHCITYGNNKYVIGCYSGYIINSTDGINWVIADYNPSGSLSRMIFINNLFFGTISGSSTYAISYDGINWNEYNYSTSGYWLALIGGNGKWYNACRNSNKLAEWTGGYLDSLSYIS